MADWRASGSGSESLSASSTCWMAVRSRMSVSTEVKSVEAKRISWPLSSFRNCPSAMRMARYFAVGVRLVLEHYRDLVLSAGW